MEEPDKHSLDWEDYQRVGETCEVCQFLLYRDGIRDIMFADSAPWGEWENYMK